MRVFGAMRARVAGVVLCVVVAASSCLAQGLAGIWVQPGRTLDNGEQQKWVLVLKQNGSDLTGTLKSLDYGVELKGTATGTHFELLAAGDAVLHRLSGEWRIAWPGARTPPGDRESGNCGGRYSDCELH
jgi:hypothetical protein